MDCGGYKKDFKWRPFEETNVASNIAKQNNGCEYWKANDPDILGCRDATYLLLLPMQIVVANIRFLQL